MLDLFQYNWQVREDWFSWCESISEGDLHLSRIGGMGSIFNNLVHVIDCELLWVNSILEETHVYDAKASISSLDEVISYSNFAKAITLKLFQDQPDDFESRTVDIQNKKGQTFSFTYGKILRHILSHEIHHTGQLSVWSREIGLKPVNCDLLIRDYE